MRREGGREKLSISKGKGLVTLHRLIHCSTEITAEPSKSSFNASIEEEEKHVDNKGGGEFLYTLRASRVNDSEREPFPKMCYNI